VYCPALLADVVDLRARITNAVAEVMPDMPRRTWEEIHVRLDICLEVTWNCNSDTSDKTRCVRLRFYVFGFYLLLIEERIYSLKIVTLLLKHPVFKNSDRTAEKTQHFTVTNINWLTLFSEVIAVYSENHIQPTNTKRRITGC
jgi:hypothetical protein